MIKEAIVKIVNKEDLTYDEAYAVMNEIMSGETSPTQNAAFLSALGEYLLLLRAKVIRRPLVIEECRLNFSEGES